MIKTKLIIGSVVLLSLIGCKSIVNDYTPEQLDYLKITLSGDGEIPGANYTDSIDQLRWTCSQADARVYVEVNNRKAKTRLEFYGKYYRDETEVTDHGRIFSSKKFYDYNLNLKIDLKRQAAKVSISNKATVDTGCKSEWIDLDIVQS